MFQTLAPTCRLIFPQRSSTTTSTTPVSFSISIEAKFSEAFPQHMASRPFRQVDSLELPSTLSFFKLPAEVRLNIYGYLFAVITIYVTNLDEGTSSSVRFNTVDRRFSILMTCRTCYTEAQSILYEAATFDVESTCSDHMINSLHNAANSFYANVQYLRLSNKLHQGSGLGRVTRAAKARPPALKILDAREWLVILGRNLGSTSDKELSTKLVNDRENKHIDMNPFCCAERTPTFKLIYTVSKYFDGRDGLDGRLNVEKVRRYSLPVQFHVYHLD